MAAVTILVIVSLLIHYETLSVAGRYVPRMHIGAPRFRIVFIVVACFLAHTIEVWVWAGGIALLEHVAGIGKLAHVGTPEGPWMDYVYFSVVTYTTIGFGDIYPTGHLRLVAGVEALTGLLMVGWSASFTYLEMQELWKQRQQRKSR